MRLNKRLIGVLTTVVSIVSLYFGMTLARSWFDRKRSSSFDSALVELSRHLNATLPMQAGETRLDKTTAGPGNRFTYAYTLINTSADEMDAQTLTQTMRPQIVNAYKTSPMMASFRDNRVEITYLYSDKNGRLLAVIVVSPNDFSALPPPIR